MRKPVRVLAAVLAASALSAVPAQAAASGPADVTVAQCTAGGGIIIVSIVGNGEDARTVAHCKGGIYDGQPVV
ncbi:hypothetical protein [Streptomyces minutiscleroticus]|uniref:Secreted protein n=1 Tax=Streptomyces minutiscleroticus TaxID=68238 RepID=A0A918ND46_9ACTN|nr:hypothetical protein [Streptomyces minutiscleroticus]GGX58812.1 hypothetical protein GCM10010358_11160 [Streptomyces minutiscleroticus]